MSAAAVSAFERARLRALNRLASAATALADGAADGASARQVALAGHALVLIQEARIELDRASRRLVDEDLGE